MDQGPVSAFVYWFYGIAVLRFYGAFMGALNLAKIPKYHKTEIPGFHTRTPIHSLTLLPLRWCNRTGKK